jgi:hypothetical protein
VLEVVVLLVALAVPPEPPEPAVVDAADVEASATIGPLEHPADTITVVKTTTLHHKTMPIILVLQPNIKRA